MKTKASVRKWHTTDVKRKWMKLANHISAHYPLDKDLHKAVKGVFASADSAVSKISKAKPKTATKRKPARKSTAKRRTTTRRKPAKRSTAKRTTTKRRTARRPSARKRAPKRRAVARRTVRQRRA